LNKNWLEWFGFKTDPFFVKPLQSDFDDLMVKTMVISSEVDRWPSVARSQPFTKLVIGQRGVGKSTAIRYASHIIQKNGMLSVYIGVPTYGVEKREPVFFATREIVRGCLQELIRASADTKPEFFTKFKDMFVKWGRFVGLTYTQLEGFVLDPTDVTEVQFDLLRDMLKSFLELANRNEVRILIAIDNLDKLPDEVIRGFLAGATSQGLFEMFNSNGASVAIAMDPDKIRTAWKSDDLSYLRGDCTVLEPLSPKQAEALIELRVKKFSDGAKIPSNPLSAEVIYEICNRQKGITRAILIEAKLICQQAFERGFPTINKDNVKRLGTSPGIDVYYQLIEDRDALFGAERLLSLAERVQTLEMPNILPGILNLFSGGQAKFSAENQQLLISESIVEIESGKYRLTLPVFILLSLAKQRGFPPEEFLSWFLRHETIEVVRVEAPGIRIKKTIEYFVNKVSALSSKKPKAEVILKRGEDLFQGEEVVERSSETWFREVVFRLRKASDRYKIVESTSWEDADNISLCETIHFVMKDFLLAFSKFFAAVGCSPPLQVRSNLSHLESWDFIWAALAAYQNQYGINFGTYRFVKNIYSSYQGAKRGAYVPNEADISEMQKMLDEIVSEISQEWEKLIVTSESTLQERRPESTEYIELHEAMRSRVSELFERMGYVETIEHYRTFKVDGQFYQRLGFFKSPTEVAELDIVRRRQEPNRKNGKIRFEYVFCEVKRGRTKSNAQDVLCFVKKCTDLINIIEGETSKLPQILKPQYYLYFVSYSGVDDSVGRALPKTEMPPRSKFDIWNVYELNKRLKEYSLPLFPVRASA